MSNPGSKSHFRTIRVAVFAWANLNVIDGSAFFVTSVAETLAQSPFVDVDIILAKPLTRTVVVDEILGRPNIAIYDPFDDRRVKRLDSRLTAEASLTHDEAVQAILQYVDDRAPDAILIRSTQVALHLLSAAPDLAGRTIVYLTGITDGENEPSLEISRALHFLEKVGASFAAQTPQMRERILGLFPGSIDDDRVSIISPMVRGEPEGSLNQESPQDVYSRLAYTGKFVHKWIPDRIISGFKQARYVQPALSLEVAGDQFKHSPVDPLFPANTKYLLQQTDGLTWHGGLKREASRELVRRSDIGISWRHPSLDSSLELSTKLLEYGALGKPSIMNRTPMHVDLFGSDYPLFVNSMQEYVDMLVRVVDEPSMVHEAAITCYEASKHFGYGPSHMRLMKVIQTLPNSPLPAPLVEDDLNTDSIMLGSTAIRELVKVLATTNIVRFSGAGPWVHVHFNESLGRASETIEANFSSTHGSALVEMMSRALLYESGPVQTVHISRTSSEQSAEDQRQAQSIGSLKKDLLELQGEYSAKNRSLADKLQRTEAALEISTKRLEALRASKLGKLQRWVWRRRKS